MNFKQKLAEQEEKLAGLNFSMGFNEDLGVVVFAHYANGKITITLSAESRNGSVTESHGFTNAKMANKFMALLPSNYGSGLLAQLFAS